MMRLDVEFANPLSQSERVQAVVALATLTKAQKVRFIRDNRTAVILAEGLSARRVHETLKEAGLEPANVVSSLDPEVDKTCDDIEESTDQKERIRAIGR